MTEHPYMYFDERLVIEVFDIYLYKITIFCSVIEVYDIHLDNLTCSLIEVFGYQNCFLPFR